MDWEKEFLDDVPACLLRQILEAVSDAYCESSKLVESQGLGAPEKKNLLPWQRRAQLEHRIKSAALIFGSPIEVTTENSGFWNHVVITCGRFRITQSSIQNENMPLSEAVYKRKYAQEQKQLLLNFGDEFPREQLDDGRFFYAVILHHAAFSESEPDFVSIRFPKADLSGYHSASIDLVEMFSERPIVSSTPVESIQDEAEPKLRKKKKAAGEA